MSQTIAQQIAELPEEARAALYAELARANDAREESAHGPGEDRMVMLGAPLTLGRVTIPPLSFGALAILEETGNGMLREDDTETGTDALELLFVAAHQDEALPLVYRLSRGRKALDETKEIAGKSPEHYRQYLEVRARLVEDVATQWDRLLREFARQLSGVSPADIRQAARALREDALAPFAVTTE